MAGTEFAFLYFLQSLHTPWLDSAMVFISSLGDHGRFFLLLAVILLLSGAVLGSVIAWAVYRLMREIEKRRQL